MNISRKMHNVREAPLTQDPPKRSQVLIQSAIFSRKLLYIILNAGTASLEKYDPKLAICKGINFLSTCVIFFNLSIGTTVSFVTGEISIIVGSIIQAIILSTVIFLNSKSKYNAASLLCYMVMNIATFYFGSILGKSAGVEIMTVFLIGLSLFFFHSVRLRIACITFSMLLLFFMEQNYKTHNIAPIHVSAQIEDIIRWIALITIIFLVIIIFYLYARNNNSIAQLFQHSKKVENTLTDQSTFVNNSYHNVSSMFFGIEFITQALKDAPSHDDRERLIYALGELSEKCKLSINNILQFSKLQAGINDRPTLELFNLRSTIQKITDIYRYSAESKNVLFEVHVSNEIPELINGDPTRVSDIITNILTNAIKFTNANSVIYISAEFEDNFLCLEIEDSGKGIHKDDLERIFDPFITIKSVKDNPHGLGLGLAITDKLVKGINGKIKVSSELNKGSKFRVFIPYKKTDHSFSNSGSSYSSM